MYYAALRAAAQRVPFNPWRSGVGTSFPDINPAIKAFKDPINGETLLAIPALNLDIAFLHAAVSDAYGNVQYVGHGYGDRAIYAAADLTFVQVEQIVSNEEIRKEPLKTAIPGADGVIRARFGAHPYSSPGHYIEDQEHIRRYVKAATAWAKENDFAPLQAYLDEFVMQPEDHAAYLERVGIRRLLALERVLGATGCKPRQQRPRKSWRACSRAISPTANGWRSARILPVPRAGVLLAHLMWGPNMTVMIAMTKANVLNEPVIEEFRTHHRSSRDALGRGRITSTTISSRT